MAEATKEQLGTVRIAPGVLATIASLTALAVPGVSRLGAGGVERLFGRESLTAGVKVQVKDQAVWVDVYIVVEAGRNMYQVGSQVQTDITQAILQMVGMPVQEVNVYIQDVE
jgi:uncharacterized alkaline shock family protein YloU